MLVDETLSRQYMAVANVIKEQPDDHTKHIAEFAIAAIAVAKSTYIDDEQTDKGTAPEVVIVLPVLLCSQTTPMLTFCVLLSNCVVKDSSLFV